MSRENVEVVLRALDAFEEDLVRGEVGRQVPDLFDAAAEYHPRETPGPLYGHDGVVQGLSEWFEVMEVSGFNVEQVIDAGDNVLVEMRFCSRGRTSGVPVSGRFWQAFTIRDRKIVSLREYSQEAEAFEAVGLRE